MFFQQLITGVSIGGVYALIATGYSLVYSLLDFSNWAHGEVAMLGAYVAFMAVSAVHLPFLVSAALGILGAALISFLNERVAYKRIRNNKSPNMFLMIAAMGLSTTYQNAATLLFGAKFKMYPAVLPVSSVQIGQFYIGVLDLVSLIITAVMLFVLILIIEKSQFGLNIRAIACNSQTAGLLGVKVDKCIAMVFLLAGGLAGAAGILLGMKYNVYPTMGNVGLKAFIASVLGGLGSVPGAIAGAILLGVIETFASGYLSSGLRDLISFTLLIVILLVRPSGLMGVDVQEKA
ncbi:MAG: branched-chain amino acid ABC transporter permease [Bacillota bacterium]|jgi:branched-chain amino acid transport system permease protein